MTFEEILPVLKAGGRAARAVWASRTYRGLAVELVQPSLPDGRPVMPLLLVESEDGVMRPFAGAQWDLLADDWEAVPGAQA